MEFNNPALRLFNLLSELKRGNPGVATSVVLSEVFKVNNNPRDLFHAIVEFHELVSEVIKFSTHKTSLPSGPLLRYIPQIESAVNFTNLDAAWANYSGRITTECLVVLEMVAHVEGVPQDKEASPDTVVELRKALDTLFEYVTKEKTLDKELRTFLLKQIEYIRRCLAEYRISGPEGFVKYVEQLMIQAGRHAEVIRREQKKDPQAMSLFNRVLVGVKKMVELTDSGTKLIKGADGVYSEGVVMLEHFSSLGSGEVPEANTVDSP